MKSSPLVLFAFVLLPSMCIASQSVTVEAYIESYREYLEQIQLSNGHVVHQQMNVVHLSIVSPTGLVRRDLEVCSTEPIAADHLLRNLGSLVEFEIDEDYIADIRPHPSPVHKVLYLKSLRRLSKKEPNQALQPTSVTPSSSEKSP